MRPGSASSTGSSSSVSVDASIAGHTTKACRPSRTSSATRSQTRANHPGFSPTGASWLPQPPEFAELALDRQCGVAGSTYELYRSALRLRREHALGSGDLAWLSGYPEDVLAFTVRDLVVVANFGTGPVAAPDGVRPLLVSTETPDEPEVPAESTVWFVR